MTNKRTMIKTQHTQYSHQTICIHNEHENHSTTRTGIIVIMNWYSNILNTGCVPFHDGYSPASSGNDVLIRTSYCASYYLHFLLSHTKSHSCLLVSDCYQELTLPHNVVVTKYNPRESQGKVRDFKAVRYKI